MKQFFELNVFGGISKFCKNFRFKRKKKNPPNIKTCKNFERFSKRKDIKPLSKSTGKAKMRAASALSPKKTITELKKDTPGQKVLIVSLE